MYENVIALYGVPRTGTSWLGQIIDSCPDTVFRFQPLFSYRFKNRITTESRAEDIEQFFKELYCEDNDGFLNQADKRENGMYPVFAHKESDAAILAFKEVRYLYTIPLLLQKYGSIKIVGIVRNPYDTMESWINAPSEYKPDWDIFEEWDFAVSKNEYRPENYYGYYKWKEYIKMAADMQKKYPDKFVIVRYEDLAEDAVNVSEKLFCFLDIPFTAQTKTFIKESQSKTVDNSYSVYRDKEKERQRQFYLPEEVKVKISRDMETFEAARGMGYL